MLAGKFERNSCRTNVVMSEGEVIGKFCVFISLLRFVRMAEILLFVSKKSTFGK
jgi:hypothetical protein